MFEFEFVLLFKFNVVTQSDQYTLIMTQRHLLSERQKWQLIGRFKADHNQMEIA